MSHFSVLVIGANPEAQLAPYHEFECTGHDDEFVQNIDITEEARADFEAGKATRYRDPEGNLHDPYQDRFYRDPTADEEKQMGKLAGTGGNGRLSWTSRDWNDGRGHRAKVHFLPDGWEEVQVPRAEVESFRDYVADYYGMEVLKPGQEPDLAKTHKFGWVRVDAAGSAYEVIDRTNPRKKWDWYLIGGRWTGFFQLKTGHAGEVGRPGVMTPPAGAGRADQAFKGSIDFAAMRDEKGNAAGAEWDVIHTTLDAAGAPHTWDSWKTVRERTEIERETLLLPEGKTWVDVARDRYHDQPSVVAIKAIKDVDGKPRFWWDMPDAAACSREAYIQAARNRACSTFAVVKDGQWYERGEMGWWGVVHDEKDQDEWNHRFNDLLDSVGDETLLTVVDCHI
jgi:hypothetical protein